MKYFSLACFAFFIFHFSFSQQIEVYPTNWWVGMKNPRLQLMLHANNIGRASKATISYAGVTIQKIFQPENPNYLFIDLIINASAKPGTLHIKLNSGEAFSFELKQRRKGNGSAYAQGIGSSDFVYLIMPDRFSNGDESNDRIPGMKDQSLNRDSMYHRHGGDIQGIINHLDYLKDMGVTTVWLTPILENDMPDRTEHGYAITNHYKVDPRHGGNQAYLHLSDELHKRGMKLMQDAVYNHCGLYNFFIQDMPMKDWVHLWPDYTQTNYRDQTIFDPHASQADRKKLLDGWFTRQMPDLNQSNPYVENFLIQNAIWCIEEFGVDGWRIDTYIYVDPEFMNTCNQALIDEYPQMTMVGEAWVHGTANEAYFTRNNLNTPFKSNATGVIDFQCLFDGIQPALTEHSDGGEHLYQTLSNDFLYKNPLNNLIFLDNHDMTRVYSQVKEDINKLKMGIGWLLTERGTPEMYYGTEILLKGISNPDGLVRGDFPGGWKSDKSNKFTSEGRTEQENEVFSWTRTIANYRKHTAALKNGNLMQFVPEHGAYTYFRYNNDKTIMVVMNFSDSERRISLDRFAERTAHYSKAKNIVTATIKDLKGEWQVPAKTMWILELQK